MSEQSKEDLKELLKFAEQNLESLQHENALLSQSFHDMMEAHKMEAEQMVQLTEQIWALEEALNSSSEGKEKALAQLGLMKMKLIAVQSQMKETLEAASKNASRMELAARVYEMSSISELSEIDRQLEAFNEAIAPGKLVK